MAVLGAVTIGQSPRSDVVSEIRPLLGEGVRIVEAGALDGLSPDEVAELAPAPGEAVLVTRLRDGSSVRVAHRHILPRLARQVEALAREVDVVLLLCTGSFPPFRVGCPVLYPDRLLQNFVRAVAPDGHLGVVTPDEAQIAEQRVRWSETAGRVTVRSASPYGDPGHLLATARDLASQRVDLVVLDSLGYNLTTKRMVRGVVGVPVVLPRTVLARAAAELL
jgi:protein AroM